MLLTVLTLRGARSSPSRSPVQPRAGAPARRGPRSRGAGGGARGRRGRRRAAHHQRPPGTRRQRRGAAHQVRGALYGRDGAVRAFTPSWRRGPPARASIAHGRATPFDLHVEGEHLRAVLEAVPGAPPSFTLLLAAPRTDLDGDAYFLRRALTMVFAVACAWTLAVASWFARRLTRDHQRITEVAHRVAGGDLSARVAQASADAEECLSSGATSTRPSRASPRWSTRSGASSPTRPTSCARRSRRCLGEVTFVLRRDREASSTATRCARCSRLQSASVEPTEDLLALARLGSTKGVEPADVAVDDVVAGAIDDVSAAARARKITVVYVRGGGRVRGYANDLRRLVRNLLENAVRHSPEGGEVRVHTLPRMRRLRSSSTTKARAWPPTSAPGSSSRSFAAPAPAPRRGWVRGARPHHRARDRARAPRRPSMRS